MQRGEFRLYYEDGGGDRPALLFLHGGGGNHLSWWQQVPAFAAEYRCITADQRGFGQSPDVDGFGPAALARDALALFDHLKIERAAVVSQSMGGWAAVGAAVLQPARLWAIVLANTVGNLVDAELSALRKSLQASKPPRPADFTDGALGASFRARDPAGRFLYAQIEGLNPRRGVEFGSRLYAVKTAVADYAAAKVPTLMITSDEDVMIFPELVEAVHAKLPGSRLVRVPKAGHSTYFEQPEVFNRTVAAFLKEHRA
jgi:3-oxoadipate enol-lactonase